VIFESLETIEAIKHDFPALKKLWKKIPRTLIKENDFSAPLMVSAHQLKHLNKIDELTCDAIMINLEDGVAPDHKEMALHLAGLFITHLHNSDKKIIVRVNALDEGGDKEIKFLNHVGVDAIRVPKIRTKKDVKKALKLIKTDAQLHLSIETKEAWKNLTTLAIHPKVSAMYLGVLDLFADMVISQTSIELNNPLMHYMLSHFLITCKSINVTPVSFVYQEHKNFETFKKWIILEKSLGFQVKGVISPDQAKIAMELFKSDDRKKRALYIIKQFEKNSKQGITGFADETYGFIDEPIYKGALADLGGKK